MSTTQNPNNDWKGGFEQSNKAFSYPDPDLSSLPMLGNMDNIDKLQRQQEVLWPEFSWETQKGMPDPKRCFQMFAPDISRLGYNDEGRVYSIICPQQGLWIKEIGCLNVEVTVTGQRGWANEDTREMAADMSVVGKIWFSPSATQKPLVKFLWRMFEESGLPFPFNKANAIIVNTYDPGNPNQKEFPLRKGVTQRFESPEFADHSDVAWTVANVEVEIGEINSTGNSDVDYFNQLVMKLFNLGAGNMLQSGNILTWNVWFTAPSVVDQEEWKNHAEKWRESIDADHGSPDGPGTTAKYFDGTPFHPVEELIEKVIEEIISHIVSNSVLKFD
ncbi:hypothetical protein SAMN04489724_1828 [Algoriphagus locisalis]|uniref:Uncharacterized protein n=1 Tax=Algoriphagus locisalis TaxID=305507 RepID=A0A1I7ABW9_9BACT|nr:hypothetical protein [Algoriphagus locisalis]SFT72310.1 hypothetical protein SAMN04489724_1828 [Algoriphagus locisalis]